MRYNVQVYSNHTNHAAQSFQLEANNWLQALRQSQRYMGESDNLNHWSITMYPDGHSVEAYNPKTQCKLRVDNPNQPLQMPRTSSSPLRSSPWDGSGYPDDKDHEAPYGHARITPVISEEANTIHTLSLEQAIEAATNPPQPPRLTIVPQAPPTSPPPQSHPLWSSLDLQEAPHCYQQGYTEPMLTRVFMKLADLDEQFDEHDHKAFTLTMDALADSIAADGAAILLLDLNDPNKLLRCVETRGLGSTAMREVHLSTSQGILSLCTRRGLGTNVLNLATEDPEPLQAILPMAGPLLCAPMQHDAQLEGLLLLYRKQGIRPFVPQELDILSYVAHRLGEHLSHQHAA